MSTLDLKLSTSDTTFCAPDGTSPESPDSDRTFTAAEHAVGLVQDLVARPARRKNQVVLPNLLLPPNDEHHYEKPTYETLRTIGPMEVLHPLLRGPSEQGQPPSMDYGYPITVDQMQDLCLKGSPTEQITILDKDGFLTSRASLSVTRALQKACSVYVLVTAVLNHDSGFVASLADNDNRKLDSQFKGARELKLKEILGLSPEEPAKWYIGRGLSYWH